MTFKSSHLILSALLMAAPCFAQYPGWMQSGSIFILTTPEGADVPATATVQDFPLLVRLNKDWFDFTKAAAQGDDLRFSTSDGKPLPYQIEEWDAEKGVASVWVRVPKITGNARQELRVFWGKPGAVSESSGKAVFNESNGYLSVWHLGDTVADEVGTLETKESGTTVTAGILGKARHFAGGAKITCGDKISNYPTGNAPHTTQLWFRPATSNSNLIGWGVNTHQGKVVMQFSSPPHLNMDCWFSDGNVTSNGLIPLNEWNQVVYAYESGNARIYVNGVLVGQGGRATPLNVNNPCSLSIGGWAGDFSYAGDLDEVRVSKVTRSAEWVRLEYENQKPMQTLVGPLVRKGNAFGVSQPQVVVAEGKSATIMARADGAQKVYWVLQRDGRESVVAVDRFSFTFDAGRVVGDTKAALKFRAVYPDVVRTKDIAIIVKEDIADPVFTLKAPAAWDGRTPIEIVPVMSNLAEIKAKGAGDLKIEWKVSGIATVKEVATEKLLLKRAQNSGAMTVTASVSNGGQLVTNAVTVNVAEPKSDPWVVRAPDKDEKPSEGQFYARDDKGEGTLYCNGTLAEAADSVFLKIYADDKLIKTETAKIGADKSYMMSSRLKPGLIKYKIEFGARSGAGETVLHTAGDIVCGDAYIIEGQSNALATDTHEVSPPETHEWIRSYGRPPANLKEAPGNLWCHPVWKARNGEKAELGWWGMELAKRLVESQKIPIFIINGAVGGTRIDQHQRNETNPTDLTTIYGRMLWRAREARITHGIRGIIWHQGENNQGANAPGGDFD